MQKEKIADNCIIIIFWIYKFYQSMRFFVYGSVIFKSRLKIIVWYPSSERTHVNKVVGTTFYFWKKRRWTARKKSACVASPISRSPRKSPCFPTKEPGIEKALHVTLALRLYYGQLCHGRQFTARLWTARFWDQKVGYCYTNGFLFHFRVFSNFLSKLGPFKSAICFWEATILLNARDGT